MLLQQRRGATAEYLAAQLEVSVRTVYRDVQALANAGVPIYAERGPHGGIRLLEPYRTSLTGLSAGEARALFMLSIPAPLDQLGMSGELKSALLKLSAALPEIYRQDEARARQRIYLDWTSWSPRSQAPPHLQLARQAVWEERRLRLQYRPAAIPWIEPLDVIIEPLGLVAKGGTWHLAGRRQASTQVIGLDEILALEILDEHFIYPQDFDLVLFWQEWLARSQASRPRYPVLVRADPQIIAALRSEFQSRTALAVETLEVEQGGWLRLRLPFETFEQARRQLLGYGGAIEVLQPLALRLSLADFAAQVAARYAENAPGSVG
jgi:predicted DNA-binding transcriptional regulator YafY